jgi:hypothetical protein
VQEIFAVQAIAGVRFPEILQSGEILDTSYALPDRVLGEVAYTPLRSDQASQD